MTPEQVAASYNQIADLWLGLSTYGLAQIERAVAFVQHKGSALDVGCGTGRLMGALSKHGIRIDGLDVSPVMIALARQRHPEARVFHAEISRWQLPMYHGALGIPETLRVLAEAGCNCRHLEYDHHPELHLYVSAQKA